MRKYCVLLSCENYVVDMDDELVQMGFYTSRYVEAIDKASAATTAIEELKSEEKYLKGMRNLDNDPPRLSADETEELESFEGIENLKPGYAFYQEEIDSEN